jgi:protein-S-isoprenylcysteine O-methyltransferase Ste14
VHLSRGPAIIATALALALVNIGLAALIVSAMGAQSFAPLWVGALVLLLGAASAVGAVMLWRQYLEAARGE